MASPDGRPIFFGFDLPWQKQPVLEDPDVVWVNESGEYVNADGEALAQEDFDLQPEANMSNRHG